MKTKQESKAALFSVYRDFCRRYLASEKKVLAVAVLCGALAAATAGFGLPMMMDKVFPIVFGAKPLPECLRVWVEAHVSAERIPLVTMWAAALAMPLLMLFRGFFSFTNTYLISKVGLEVLEKLRLQVFSRLQELPLAYHDKRSRGDLMSTVIYFTQMLQTSMLSITNDLVIQPLTLLAALGFLAWQACTSNEVGLLLMNLLLAGLCIPATKKIGNRMIKRMKESLSGLNEVASVVSQNLAAQRDVRAFGLEEQQTVLLRAKIRLFVNAIFKMQAWKQALTPIIEILSVVALSVSLYFGVSGGIDLAQFTAIALALYYCYDPIKRLGNVYNTLQIATTMLGGIDAVLFAKDEMPEPKDPVKFERVRGEIAFEHVGFAYKPGVPVLKDIHVTFPAGQIVALVGPSGSGKTTFINLICRFYDPATGVVRLDGTNLKDIARADRTQYIGLVSQSPVLFKGTVRENIRMGKPSASDAEVEAAGKLAAVDEFIYERKEGYDRAVGEDGEGLSGGQRQRVSIARAFLKNAPVLILDEATASLDMLSEEKIQHSLDELMQGRTTFIIAHRFSTIRRAQRILVFDAGRIVADGSHEELYARSALYRDLYDKQVATGGNAA